MNIVTAQSPGATHGVTHEARPNRTAINLPGLRHETKDVLKQMQNNLAQLEDLSARLGFLLTDVRSVIRR